MTIRLHLPRSLQAALLALTCVAAAPSHADTAIETETAQIGRKGESNFSQAFEFEDGPDGSGQGTLTQYEYAFSDRAEILIEPFFYQRISPEGESSVSGLGDLEITPSYMVVREEGATPAVLLAFKLKVPTGSKKVEGSGKFDYYPYIILGKHAGGWTLNANFGVNFAQPVDDSKYDKQVVWDLEAEREIAPHLTWFVEVFSAEEGVKTISTSAEYQFTRKFNAFAVIARTKEHANVGRIGFNYAMGQAGD
ncbi:MAG: transporter [Steroidobacteraceae bacterium]